MPATEDDIFKCLDALGITHATYRHRPVFTVAESADLHEAMPGAHCKTLFLKDKDDVYLLAVVMSDRRVDLKALGRNALVPGGRLSFASPEALWDRMGVTPGSVTPFALINESSNGVHVLVDKRLLAYELVNFHPLHNAATTAVSADGLLKFIRHSGHQPLLIDFDML
jgi:Ala-tRNA(Pro) deacylase